jgi:hypothetical protein
MVTVRGQVMLEKQAVRFVCFAAEARFHNQHFHRLSAALARSPSLALAATAPILAQNESLRPWSAFVFGLGAGAFKFEPVAALYLARPFSVKPAPLDAGSFSPRPTDNETLFFVAI